VATLNFNSRRTITVDIEVSEGKTEQVTVTHRVATAQERTAFRCALAADKGARAITNPQDKDALRDLLGGDISARMDALAIDCTLDIRADDGTPVEFDGKPWTALTDAEKADVATMLPKLFQLVFAQANPQAEARLLGK
jgi:hypothetical protein